MSEKQDLKSMGFMLKSIEDPHLKRLLEVMIANISRLDNNDKCLADNPVPNTQLTDPFLYPGVYWDDELSSLNSGKVPASNAPTWTAFGPSGICYQWAFGINDHIQTTGFHIRHAIKPGSNIYPHVHWTTDGTDTNSVVWQLSYTVAKGHDQEPFPADVTIDLEQNGSGTAWQHMIVEATDAQAIVAPEVDSLIVLDLKRISNGGTDNADNVFGIYVIYTIR